MISSNIVTETVAPTPALPQGLASSDYVNNLLIYGLGGTWVFSSGSFIERFPRGYYLKGHMMSVRKTEMM